MGWHWLTTAAGPADKTHSADQGQRGWCLHLVYVPKLKGETGRGRKAVCGLRPYRGWGVDLFIDTPCSRCLRWIKKHPGIENHIPKPE